MLFRGRFREGVLIIEGQEQAEPLARESSAPATPHGALAEALQRLRRNQGWENSESVRKESAVGHVDGPLECPEGLAETAWIPPDVADNLRALVAWKKRHEEQRTARRAWIRGFRSAEFEPYRRREVVARNRAEQGKRNTSSSAVEVARAP